MIVFYIKMSVHQLPWSYVTITNVAVKRQFTLNSTCSPRFVLQYYSDICKCIIDVLHCSPFFIFLCLHFRLCHHCSSFAIIPLSYVIRLPSFNFFLHCPLFVIVHRSTFLSFAIAISFVNTHVSSLSLSIFHHCPTFVVVHLLSLYIFLHGLLSSLSLFRHCPSLVTVPL